jgi:hypothetical protein
VPGSSVELLDVVGHKRTVGQVEPGEQEILLIMVPVRGQVGGAIHSSYYRLAR